MNRLNNEDGLVLVTVSAILILMVALTATILSLSMGQQSTAETEFRQMQAIELAKGMVAYYHATQQSGIPFENPVYSPQLEGRRFTATLVEGAAGSGINDTRRFQAVIRY